MKKVFQISLGVGILAALLAICFFIFHIPDIWPQLLAIIASACLGIAGTSFVTRLLLKSQQESDENKIKNIHLYQSKMKALSAFTKELWSQASKGDYLDYSELKTLRTLLFDKVLFFLTKSDIEGLTEIFKESDSKPNTIKLYSEITVLLKNSLDDDKTKRNSINVIYTQEELSGLWRAISKHIPTDEPKVSTNNQQDNNEDATTTDSIDNVEENDGIQFNKPEFNQAWHFAMWDERQLEAIGEGKINELSLVEYEEEWRTNLVKQVEKDDIVFLFRRGGYGYVGAFKPLGWRIFDYNEQKETLHIFGQQEQVKPVNDDDVMKYDIYNGRDDSADLCSNLIVEPIAYVPDGVGNPGGVYRRTISRYDAGYAATLLERFKKKEMLMINPSN